MLAKFGLCCSSLVKNEVCMRDAANFCRKWIIEKRRTSFSILYFFHRSSRSYFMRAGALTAFQCHYRSENGIIARRNLPLTLALQLDAPKLLCTTRYCLAASKEERLTIESDLIQKYLHNLLAEYTERRSPAGRNMAELEAVVSRFILYQQKKEEISELIRMITGFLTLKIPMKMEACA